MEIIKINDVEFKKNNIYNNIKNELTEDNIYQLSILKLKNYIEIKAYIYQDDNYGEDEEIFEITIRLDKDYNIIDKKCKCNYHSLLEIDNCENIANLIRHINSRKYYLGYSKISPKEIGKLSIYEYKEIKEKINYNKYEISKIFKEIIEDKFSEKNKKYSLIPIFEKNIVKYAVKNRNMYKLKELSKFVKAYINKTYIRISDDLLLKAGEELFDEFSKKQLEFLIKYSKNISANILRLSHANIDDFYELYNSKYELFNKGIFDLEINIKNIERDVFKLETKIDNNTLVGNNKIYFFNENNKITYVNITTYESIIFRKIYDIEYLDIKLVIYLINLLNKYSSRTKINNSIYNLELKIEINKVEEKPYIIAILFESKKLYIKVEKYVKGSLEINDVVNVFKSSGIKEVEYFNEKEVNLISNVKDIKKFMRELAPILFDISYLEIINK